MTVVVIILVIVLWIGLQNLSTATYDAMTALVLFFQLITVVTKYNLRWHPYCECMYVCV
jgi:hypothetical protein